MFSKTKTIGFRKWLTLENLKSKFLEAVESESFTDKVYSYLSTALGVPKKILGWQSWDKTVGFIVRVSKNNIDNSIPLLSPTPKESKPADWDYDGRNWFYFSHLLAHAYGWDIEYIAKLDANEALKYLQEILVDDQLEKEFYYRLSEVAYPYNKSTKKSEFSPMKRPYWMKPLAPQTIKRIKIRKDLLPVGYIKDVSGLPPQYQIEGLKTEK